jgi:hypothetical protein
MSFERRRQMVEPEHPQLSIVRQCELVSISRSGPCQPPAGGSRHASTPLNLELMRLIDAQFLEAPWYGSRQMARHLRREGYVVGRRRVRRRMARMGLAPISQRPLDGQCLHRAAVAQPEVRMRLAACLRDRLGGAGRAHDVDRLLQRQTSAQHPGRTNL